jgi:hypothetical protein
MTGHADRNDFFTEFIHIEVKLFQEKMLSPNLQEQSWLRSWVQLPPGPSFPVVQLRY